MRKKDYSRCKNKTRAIGTKNMYCFAAIATA